MSDDLIERVESLVPVEPRENEPFAISALRALVARLRDAERERDVWQQSAEAHRLQHEVFAGYSKAREELLTEIDDVIGGTVYWQGGRLDTIKHLLVCADAAEAKLADVLRRVRERATRLDRESLTTRDPDTSLIVESKAHALREAVPEAFTTEGGSDAG